MPHIEVRSTSDGGILRIDSANPATIVAWLAEVFDLIQPKEWCPAQVSFQPLRNADGAPDWPTKDRRMLGAGPLLVSGPGMEGVRQLARELTVFADGEDTAHAEELQERFADGHPV